MWKAFLAGWNGRSFFLDTTVTPSPDLELYTDASGSVSFGVISVGNGSRVDGPLTCSYTGNGV